MEPRTPLACPERSRRVRGSPPPDQRERTAPDPAGSRLAIVRTHASRAGPATHRWPLDRYQLPARQFLSMKSSMIVGFCFLLALFLASAQPTPQATTNSQNPDRVQIEATLQRYIAAYVHRSSSELLAVWPDLENRRRNTARSGITLKMPACLTSR